MTQIADRNVDIDTDRLQAERDEAREAARFMLACYVGRLPIELASQKRAVWEKKYPWLREEPLNESP